jgi:hypothetical protein
LDIDTGHLYAIKRIKIEQQDEEDQEIMVIIHRALNRV